MSRIVLGEHDEREVKLDVDIVLKTRLLIQGGSGSGKSWLIRRLAEQLFGKLPVIIIDPEGEFATLREKYGYVLVGQGGETPADVRSAGLVAHKLLELHASAVCDIYEMKPHERHRWVQLFLEALIDAPKTLWQPAVVIVDEAHMFCPEKGAGESEASESMVALTTRGRKRGFVPVFATQRLGKLRKDAAAELQNVLLGRTFIDIDRDRALETLGAKKEPGAAAFSHELKTLPEGHFWGFGPAIALERTLITIGPVETTHPKLGAARSSEPPPAPEKVRALLPKLADLPQQAEAKAITEAELRRQVAEKDRRIKELERITSAFSSSNERAKQEVPVLTDADRQGIEALRSELATFRAELDASLSSALDNVRKAVEGVLSASVDQLISQHAHKVELAASRLEKAGFQRILEKLGQVQHAPVPRLIPRRGLDQVPTGLLPGPILSGAPRRLPASGPGDASLSKGERVVLTAVVQYPAGVTREQLTVLTGYKRSSRDTYLQKLIQRELVAAVGPMLVATDAGLAALGAFDPLPSGDDLRDYWMGRLPTGERAVLEVLVAHHPKAVDREVISDRTGYKRSSRDTYLQKLIARRLVDPVGRGAVKANAELFS